MTILHHNASVMRCLALCTFIRLISFNVQAARLRPKLRVSGKVSDHQTSADSYCPTGMTWSPHKEMDGKTTTKICTGPRKYYQPVPDWSSQDLLAVDDWLVSDIAFTQVGLEPIAWDLADRRFRLVEQFESEFRAAMEDQQFMKRMALGVLLDAEGEPQSKPSVFKQLGQQIGLTWGEVVVPAMLWSRVVSPSGLVTILSGVATEFGIVAGWVPIVGWIITGVLTAVQGVAVAALYKQQERQARKTMEGLAMSANCARRSMGLSPVEARSRWEKNTFFRTEVAESCGLHAQSQLLMVMQRANFALRRLLKAIEDYGRCLYPAPYDAYSNRSNQSIIWWKHDRTRRISCFIGVHGELLTLTSGGPGLLTTSLSFIATYARSADALLQLPLYTDLAGNSWVEDLFGVSAVEAEESDLEKIQAEVEKQSQGSDLPLDAEQIKAVSCMMLTAMHRAFEMTLKRLAKAWNMYGRSYMFDTRHVTARNRPWPCTTFFFEKDSDLEENGMCRNDLFENAAGFHVTGSVTSLTQNRQFIEMSKLDDVCIFARDAKFKVDSDSSD